MKSADRLLLFNALDSDEFVQRRRTLKGTGEVEKSKDSNFVNRYRWVVFGLLAFAYLLVYFHRLSPAVVAVDMMKDLSAGGALLGLLGSAYFYPYALMQVPAGLLADTWGPRRTVTFSFVLAGAASIWFGFASSATEAVIARVLVGLGVSMLFVPTVKILTKWFKKEEFAQMSAWLMMVGGIGVLTAATPLAYMSDLIGWRGSFIAIGFVTMVLAGAIWIFVRNSPQEMGASAETVEADNAADVIPLWQGVKMVLSRKSFWPLAIWFFCIGGVFFSFSGLWGGPYLMHVYGLTKAQAGYVLSMSAAAMIVGCPLLGYLSERIFHSRKKIILAASFLVVFLTAYAAFKPAGFSRVGLYIFCFLLSLSTAAAVIIAFTATKELFPASMAGTSVGLINFFPFFGGAVFQPVLGVILEASSNGGETYSAQAYGNGFFLYLIAAAVALVAAFFVEETLTE